MRLLMRRKVSRDNEHPLKPKRLCERARQMDMAAVRRVKGAAINADTPPAWLQHMPLCHRVFLRWPGYWPRPRRAEKRPSSRFWRSRTALLRLLGRLPVPDFGFSFFTGS